MLGFGYRRAAVCLFCAATQACAYTAPVFNPKYHVSAELADSPFQAQQVLDALNVGLQRKRWEVVHREPGAVVARMSRNDIRATIRVEHDGRGFWIQHVESSEKLAYRDDPERGPVIRPRYNGWVRRLRDEALKFLRNPIRISEKDITAATSADDPEPDAALLAARRVAPPVRAFSEYDQFRFGELRWQPSTPERELAPPPARALQGYLRERFKTSATDPTNRTVTAEVQVIRLLFKEKKGPKLDRLADVFIDLDVTFRDRESGRRLATAFVQRRAKSETMGRVNGETTEADLRKLASWAYIGDVIAHYLYLHGMDSAWPTASAD